MLSIRTMWLRVIFALGVSHLAAAVGITLSPTSATVNQGATKAFTATVSGTTNKSVTWSVIGTGNGSVSTSGVYTAPIKQGTFKVRATSKANTSKYAEATVTVPNIALSVSPTTVTVKQRATQQFTATVTGAANTGVTWSVPSGQGAISASGLYTAPATSGTYPITATSKADTTKKATATATVTAAVPPSITTQPSNMTVTLGSTATFTVVASGTGTLSYQWSKNGTAISGATMASYTTPATVTGDNGATFTVKVTNTYGNVTSSDATLTVTVPIVVTVSPITTRLVKSGTAQFSVQITGSTNTSVTWSATGGTISASGLYKAPTTSGTYTITATVNVAGSTKKATASVTVLNATMTITPSAAMVQAGNAINLTVKTSGLSSSEVNWILQESDAGTLFNWIDDNDNPVTYFSVWPTVGGVFHVTATSVIEPTIQITATISVPYLEVSPAEVSLGQSVTLKVHSFGLSGTVDPNIGAVSDGSVFIVQPNGTTDYVLRVKNASNTTFEFHSLARVIVPGSLAETIGDVPQSLKTPWERLSDGRLAAVDSQNRLVVFDPASRTFEIKVSMDPLWKLEGDSGSSLTELPDGKLLCAGGIDSTLVYWKQIKYALIDVGSGQVEYLETPPAGHSRHQAVLLPDGRVLLISGRHNVNLSGTYTTDSTELAFYNPFDGTFIDVPESNLGFNDIYTGGWDHHAVLMSNGQVFLNGGWKDSAGAEVNFRISVYDPGLNQFVPGSGFNDYILKQWNGRPFSLPGGKVFLTTKLTMGNGQANEFLPLVFDPLTHDALSVPDTKTLPAFRALALMQNGWLLGNGLCLLGSESEPTPSPIGISLFDPSSGQYFSIQGDQRDTNWVDDAVPLRDGRFLILRLSPDWVRTAQVFQPELSVVIRVPPGKPLTGDSVSLSASSADGGAITWSAPEGAITSDGLFSSNQAGLFAVMATSANGDLATAWVRIWPRNKVEVQQTQVSLQPGGFLLLSSLGVTVDGRPSKQVKWTIPGEVLYEAYFAPAFPGVFQVIATSTVDPSQKAVVTVTVQPCPDATLTLSPENVTLLMSGSQNFTARVNGCPGSMGVIFSVTGGTCDRWGMYLPPTTPGVYTLTATSEGNPAVKATATITVQACQQAPTVTIRPAAVTMYAGEHVTFTATVNSCLADKSLVWSCTDGDIQGGVYTPPATHMGTYAVSALNIATSARGEVIVDVRAPVLVHQFQANPQSIPLGGTVTLTWLAADPSSTLIIMNPSTRIVDRDVTGLSSVNVTPAASRTYRLHATRPGFFTDIDVDVTVTAPVSITITPKTITLAPGQSQQFGFTLVAPTNRKVWSATGGEITQAGLYTAPPVPGTYKVNLFSVDDPGKSDSAIVTVSAASNILLNLSPTVIDLVPGQSLQFGYSYEGPADSALQWSCTGGTITQAGLYTASQTIGNSNVSLTSLSYGVSASAQVSVKPALGLSIDPASTTLATNRSAQFTATVSTGTVAWTVLESGGGTISQTGLYSAPATPGTYTIQATSDVDPNKKVQAQVKVVQVAISITPTTVTLEVNQAMTFGASLNAGGWVWSATGGTITDQGQYQAPLTTGTYQVSVQSLLDPSQMAVSTVTVTPANNLVLLPSSFTIGTSGTQALTVSGQPNGAPITWSVDPLVGGTVNGNGIFTAGSTPGKYTITAWVDFGNGYFLAAYSVATVVSHKILPDSPLVLPGGQIQFSSQVFDGSAGVSWSVAEGTAGGAIDASGHFTAPVQQGVYHVIAQTSAGNLAQTRVIVGPPDGFLVMPEISIQEAGTYSVRVRLQASNGKTAESLCAGDFPLGYAYPGISFSGDQILHQLGVDGPYSIAQILLEQTVDEELAQIDTKVNMGSTGAYSVSEASKEWITIGDIQEVQGLDTNSNGLIDLLVVTVPVQVVANGAYAVGGSLVSPDGKEVDYVDADQTWTSGTHLVSLAFDGKRIKAHGKEGPFTLKGFYVRTAVVERKKDFSSPVQGFALNQFESAPQ